MMLADNHAQAFSVARLTAMFSALLRTCDTEVVLSQGVRTVVNAQDPRLARPPPHVHVDTHSPTALLSHQPSPPPQDYFLRTAAGVSQEAVPHGTWALLLAEPERRQRPVMS